MSFRPYQPGTSSASPFVPRARPAVDDTVNPFAEEGVYEMPFEDQKIEPANCRRCERLYYQVCRFADRQGRITIRKYSFDAQYVIRGVKEYQLSKDQLRKLVETKGAHQISYHAGYSLSRVDPPAVGDLITAASECTATDYDYSGLAPFREDE